jgi:hypothetical protein
LRAYRRRLLLLSSLTPLDELRRYRKLALQQFISDYDFGRKSKRYVKAALPRLPFDDRSFDLVLSGHFILAMATIKGVGFAKTMTPDHTMGYAVIIINLFTSRITMHKKPSCL